LKPKTPIIKNGSPTPIPNNNILEAAVIIVIIENVDVLEAIPIKILTTTGPTHAEESSPALMPIKKVMKTPLLALLAFEPENKEISNKSNDDKPNKNIIIAIIKLVTGKCKIVLKAPPVNDAITPNKKYIHTIPI
jgi:hypothetical protein